MRAFGRDLIRGGHYGQRSCEPHSKAEHMAAPTNAAKREESSCQSGAVHTWALLEPEHVPGGCQLSGVEQTCRTGLPRSESDPYRTFSADRSNEPRVSVVAHDHAVAVVGTVCPA